MSTGLIIAIIVVAIILVALLALMPRMRERARVKKQERELRSQREQTASRHRQEAESRVQSAEAAEQRARMAEQEARRERADAELHKERAAATERGMADHELVGNDERGDHVEDRIVEQRDAEGGLLGRFRRSRTSDRETAGRSS